MPSLPGGNPGPGGTSSSPGGSSGPGGSGGDGGNSGPNSSGLPGSGLPGDGSGSDSPTGSGSQSKQGGQSNLPGGQDGGDGWETSNELPGKSQRTNESKPADDAIPDERSQSDRELDEALGDFDGKILSERDTDDPITPSAHPGGSGGASSGGELLEVDGQQEDAPEDGSGAAAANSIPEAPPMIVPDTPDAKDDDVVARQLKEAAEAEPDPELREALWEEYYRYKAGLRKSNRP